MDSLSAPATSTLVSRLAKKISRCTPEESLGMRLRQFWALSYVTERDGATQHELGDAFMLDANNVVLLLNELEAAGFIERRRDPDDRRRHVVYATDAGRDAVKRAERGRAAIEDDVLGALAPKERETLQRLLAKALEG
jgi:DNA-binding MarR family transcriptional regulator